MKAKHPSLTLLEARNRQHLAAQQDLFAIFILGNRFAQEEASKFLSAMTRNGRRWPLPEARRFRKARAL